MILTFNFIKNTINFETNLNLLKSINWTFKILEIKKITKVVKGGKILRFRTILVIGNNKNTVGLGIGKADDIAISLEKAFLNAKKNIIYIFSTKKKSIFFSSLNKFKASQINLYSTNKDTGILVSNQIRSIFELAGIQNILGKQYKSKNILNSSKNIILSLIKLNQKYFINNFFFKSQKYLKKKLINN